MKRAWRGAEAETGPAWRGPVILWEDKPVHYEFFDWDEAGIT